MKNKNLSRRKFIQQNSAVGFGTVLGMSLTSSVSIGNARVADTPAILGGPRVRTKGWTKWPIWNPETDEKPVVDVLRSGVWSRSKVVAEFEQRWAETIGTKRCLATVNGTNALITALKQLGIGGGDEVIVQPYTWIATTQAILQTGAIPIFADIDPETFQLDPNEIEAKITPRTRAILPVHICGLPADMVRIMEIAKKHNLIVVEDCCQAWLAEINHQIVGTFGHAGCFSFQSSKNIAIGEGGGIVSDDEEFMDRCYSYHNMGQPYGSVVGDNSTDLFVTMGSKVRLSEYQAAVGLVQLKRLEAQTVIRNDNADYLRSQMTKIPGILPNKLYDNVTRAAYHLFPFRYKEKEFKGLSRTDFIKALNAEGIPCSHGYGSTLNSAPYLKDAFQSKNFQLMYPKEMLDFDKYVSENRCPKNEQLCKETVWFSQNMLLGNKSDIEDIVIAIEKIYASADRIKMKN